MANFWKSFRELTEDFAEKRIPTAKPGFYDHPNFVREEKADPAYLANYGRFVNRRTYDEAYLARARREVPVIASLFHAELLKTKRLGACVDASQALSRILEREGFWNYYVNGSLVVRFPTTSRLSPTSFWAIDFGTFQAGHAWICVPPFQILDITLKLQPYVGQQAMFIPDMMVVTDPPVFKAVPTDFISPAMIEHLSNRGFTGSRLLEAASPHLERFRSVFPAYDHVQEQTSFRYVSICVKASDQPLENITNMRYSGLLAIDVYRTIIIPTLSALRIGDRQS